MILSSLVEKHPTHRYHIGNHAQALALAARTNGIPEDEVLEKIMLANSPIKRLVEPDEVGSLAVWLASDRSGMVTGATYTMDGGWTAR